MEKVAVVIDTREQAPYAFDPAIVIPVPKALAAGDYALAGHEDRAAIERKTLEDYVKTVVLQRERFGRELEKLAILELGCVVVEATVEDVLCHRYRSGIHPHAVLGATFKVIVEYGVPVYFLGDRQLACRFVQGLLLRFHRKLAGVGEQAGPDA